MSERKVSAADKSTKPSPPRRKKPTLSQQVKDQATVIAELTAELNKKKNELLILNKQTHLIDQLNHKLQLAEHAMKEDRTQSSVHDKVITELQEQLVEKEQQVTTVGEQTALIDELTEKLQEVEIKLLATHLQNKHVVAQNTVKTHMLAGMALGVLPAPLFDIAALTGTQLNLLRSLSRHYGVDFDEKTGNTILTSLVSGSLPVLTVLGLSSFAKIIPGIGTIGGSIGVTTLAGCIIYATGQVFIRHFETGGTFEDFNSKHWKSFFKEQLQEGKKNLHIKKDVNNTKITDLA